MTGTDFVRILTYCTTAATRSEEDIDTLAMWRMWRSNIHSVIYRW